MDSRRGSGESADDAAQPEGLGHVLRSTLSQAWDYFHLVIAGSLLWAVSVAVPTLATAFMRDLRLIGPTFYLVAALTVGPLTVGLYGMSEAMMRRELPGLGALFESLRRLYWRAVGLFLVETFVLGGALFAAWFYQARFHFWLLQAVSLLWVYGALFWLMMSLYVPAFLVREGGSVWSALRNGALLTLAHPGYTFLVLLQIAFVLVLIAVPVFARYNLALGISFLLFFLFLPGFVPLLATNAMEDLLRKHRAAEGEEEGDADEANRAPEPDRDDSRSG